MYSIVETIVEVEYSVYSQEFLYSIVYSVVEVPQRHGPEFSLESRGCKQNLNRAYRLVTVRCNGE